MENSKATKRALLTSALAVVLCVAMLIGTTFAWFTDTASTGVNKIQAGNLDVELEYSYDMEEWAIADKNTKLFKTDVLWEPGHTEVVYIRVANNGNLALKYAISLASNYYASSGTNVDGNRYLLGDYLKVGGVYTDSKFETREAAQAAITGVESSFTGETYLDNDKRLEKDETSEAMAVVIYMPTTVGNVANPKPGTTAPAIAWVGINVYAGQATVENDSFGNDYDERAPLVFKAVTYIGGTHEVTQNMQASGKWGVVAVNGGTTTVNADVYAEYDVNAAVAVWASANWNGTVKGHIVINGGYFTQLGTPEGEQCDLIYADKGATIEINGGKFKCSIPKWTLNCKDGSGSTITVKGGSFYKFNPATDGNNGEVVIPSGYKVVNDGDWYTVVAE